MSRPMETACDDGKGEDVYTKRKKWLVEEAGLSSDQGRRGAQLMTMLESTHPEGIHKELQEYPHWVLPLDIHLLVFCVKRMMWESQEAKEAHHREVHEIIDYVNSEAPISHRDPVVVCDECGCEFDACVDANDLDVVLDMSAVACPDKSCPLNG